jgi:hypothetical protein
MNPNSPIYSVVHICSKYRSEELESQETIVSRWFESWQNAKRYYIEIALAPFVYTLEDGMITLRESKYLCEFSHSAKTKALIAKEPSYDAERLAQDLKLDPRTGILLRQEPL